MAIRNAIGKGWATTRARAAGCSRALGRSRAAAVADACANVLNSRPNPFGQILYLILVLGGHFSFVEAVQMKYLGSDAWATATAGTFTTALATWVCACCADPGVIDLGNYEKYLAAYAYDGVVYSEKVCRTLGVAAPARSKFCTTTKRRVARFDHFCVWVNNTVGANNTRWFILFLAAQTWLVAYVTYACAYAVRRDLRERDAWNIVFQGSTKKGEPRTIGNDMFDVGWRFIMYHYGPAVILGVFCAVIGVALALFLAYHVRLAATNVTTNEEFKWEIIKESVQATKAAKAAAKADDGEEKEEDQDDDENDTDAAPAGVNWDEIMKNRYDVGVVGNLKEILFPPVPTPSTWRLPMRAP